MQGELGWGRQSPGTRTAALGLVPEEQVLERSHSSSVNPAWIRGFGGQSAPHCGLGSGEVQQEQLSP